MSETLCSGPGRAIWAFFGQQLHTFAIVYLDNILDLH